MCLANIPELTYPGQLTLFAAAEEPTTVNNSTDAGESIQANEPLIRSPTSDGQKRESVFASSLYRKSRELASKYFNQKPHENVLPDNE